MQCFQGSVYAKFADAEIFIMVDSRPDLALSLQLKAVSASANSVFADSLHDAYVNKTPVSLYHQISPTQSNYFKILMVQLN